MSRPHRADSSPTCSNRTYMNRILAIGYFMLGYRRFCLVYGNWQSGAACRS